MALDSPAAVVVWDSCDFPLITLFLHVSSITAVLKPPSRPAPQNGPNMIISSLVIFVTGFAVGLSLSLQLIDCLSIL